MAAREPAAASQPAVIPSVIHRIWLGSSPLPADFERYGSSWREHHPSWEMRLWTDADIAEFGCPEAFARTRHHGERSDLMRYELLWRYGGLYVDTDMECLRSIEPLLEGARAVVGLVRPGKLGNAVLAAAPGHPAFEELLARARAGAGSGHVGRATGPGLVTSVLLGADDVRILEPEAFYSFHPVRSPDRDRRPPGAYGIHHVEATWKSRDDLRDEIRRLRDRLERASARRKRLERAVARLRRQARRARDRGGRLHRALGRASARLDGVERSRWWRLRRRVATLLARGRRIGP
jgi:mannosyltransferase OCH1-like enzyme